jgi:hypothetical protein
MPKIYTKNRLQLQAAANQYDREQSLLRRKKAAAAAAAAKKKAAKAAAAAEAANGKAKAKTYRDEHNIPAPTPLAGPDGGSVERMARRGPASDKNMQSGAHLAGMASVAASADRGGKILTMPGDYLQEIGNDHESMSPTAANNYLAPVTGPIKSHNAGFTKEGDTLNKAMGNSDFGGGMNVGLGVLSGLGGFGAYMARGRALQRQKAAKDGPAILQEFAKREVSKQERQLTKSLAGMGSATGNLVGGTVMPLLNLAAEGTKAVVEGERAVHHTSGALGINDFSRTGGAVLKAKKNAMKRSSAYTAPKRTRRARSGNRKNNMIRNMFAWRKDKAAKKKAKSNFKGEYHDVLNAARHGEQPSWDTLHTDPKWSNYHAIKTVDKNRRYLHNTKAAKAAEHATLAAGHAADGIGGLTMVVDGGITRVTGKSLKASVGLKRGAGRFWSRIKQVRNLAKTKRAVGYKGKSASKDHWAFKAMFGDLEKSQAKTRAHLENHSNSMPPALKERHLRNLMSPKERHAHEMSQIAEDGGHHQHHGSVEAKNLMRDVLTSSGIVPKKLRHDEGTWSAKASVRGGNQKDSVVKQLALQDLGVNHSERVNSEGE